MDKEIQDMLNDLPNKKFAKLSDAKLEKNENHKILMLINNPNKGKIGALRGKKFSEEHKQKIGLKHKGKVVSEKTRQKLKELNKGKKLSKETIEKLRQKSIGLNVGRKHSDEARKKHSENAKNRIFTEETRKKMSEKRKGKKLPESAKINSILATSKPILCFSMPDMKFICEYPSIKSAAKDLKRNIHGIIKICKGKIKNPRKYTFRYKEIV
jgi:hypothetical protein